MNCHDEDDAVCWLYLKSIGPEVGKVVLYLRETCGFDMLQVKQLVNSAGGFVSEGSYRELCFARAEFDRIGAFAVIVPMGTQLDQI